MINHSQNIGALLQLHENDGVQKLDPLHFDEKLSILHLLNSTGDVKEICQLLYSTLPTPDILEEFSYEEAVAAMRDLGIFMGILKRHGIEPVEVMPELEYVLLVLMVKTDLPPRDTLTHYTLWNPSGERMRTYTGTKDEVQLIESVKIAFPDLIESIFMLDSIYSMQLEGIEFEMACLRAKEKIESMVKGIVHAKRNVSPAFFANELRFYYDPIKVDYRKEYIGPGAVELPMFLFDHILWNCDVDDSDYITFKEGYLPFNLKFVRDIYWRYKGKPSLVSLVKNNLNANPSEKSIRAAEVVLEFFNILKSFRMPHKKLAEHAYAHNDEQHREKGSGGYSVNILQSILSLQHKQSTSLQESLVHAKVIVS